MIREANGITVIVSTLDQHKLTNQEISMNCINALLLLLSNGIFLLSYSLRLLTFHKATNREVIAETDNIKIFIGCLNEGTSMQVQEKTLSLLHNLTVASMYINLRAIL